MHIEDVITRVNALGTQVGEALATFHAHHNTAITQLKEAINDIDPASIKEHAQIEHLEHEIGKLSNNFTKFIDHLQDHHNDLTQQQDVEVAPPDEPEEDDDLDIDEDEQGLDSIDTNDVEL